MHSQALVHWLKSSVQRCLLRNIKEHLERQDPVRNGEGMRGRVLTTCVPSTMDAFGGVLEVELHALVHKAGVAGHDNCPARV